MPARTASAAVAGENTRLEMLRMVVVDAVTSHALAALPS